MPSKAANLPQELLVLINGNISPEDRYACLFVCRQWHCVFVQLFYSNVTLHSLQRCTRFYRTLCQSGKDTHRTIRPLPLGHFVKKLCIKQHSPPPIVMQQIPSLCPSLWSLEFSKAEDRLVSYEKEPLSPLTPAFMASLTPNRAVMSQLLFTHYSSLQLSELTLECYSGIKSLVFLSAMPQLRRLSLKWKGEWRMEDMDVLHILCGYLEMLQISATSFEFSMHDGINFDFETKLAPTIRRIDLSVDRGLSATGYTPWLVYFAKKYPQLESLKLSGRFDPEVAYDIFPEEEDREEEDLPVILFPEITQWRRDREVTRMKAYRLFFESCTHIKILKLINMRLYRGFFSEMFQSGKFQLSHLSIHDEMLFPTRQVNAAVRRFGQTLTSLSLYAEESGEDSWRRGSPLDLPRMLKRLPALRNLCLGDMHHVSLPLLLDAGPQIESLTLIHVRLDLSTEYPGELDISDDDDDEDNDEEIEDHDQNGIRTAIRTKLKELYIRRTPLRQETLDHISRRCTLLKKLLLENCGIYGAQKGLISIDFADQTLDSLILDNLVFKDEEGFLRYYTGEDFHVKTFALQTMDSPYGKFRGEAHLILEAQVDLTSMIDSLNSYRWYDTGSFVNRQRSAKKSGTVLGIRPLNRQQVIALKQSLQSLGQRKLRLERVNCAGYIMIRCRALHRIHANQRRLLDDSIL